MMPRRHWQDMTTAEFAGLDRTRVIAVLPVAAIEQHGPHLPVAVDACIGRGIVERLVARLPVDLPVTILPMIAVGKSNEHQGFPGTLTLSTETLTRVWTEVGESVARAGIRKLVILNSHGGQPQIMDIVARDLRVRHAMFVVAASYWGVGGPQGLFPDAELRHGIHGGSAETSMMLYLRPDLVRDAERRNFVPASVALERDYRHLRPEGAGVGFGWQTQDLNPMGACGDATDADAARGQRIIEQVADGLVELLREVDRYPLDKLRPGPLG
ncbi:MAG TPA: creatininase family protein [Candidatus Sulfotelmatobacter sp.]|nr:creatininase family protein [Candidatus Sulfotelmatobacter sp.]